MSKHYFVVVHNGLYLKLKKAARSFFSSASMEPVFEEGIDGALPFCVGRGVTRGQALDQARVAANKYGGQVQEIESEAGVRW